MKTDARFFRLRESLHVQTAPNFTRDMPPGIWDKSALCVRLSEADLEVLIEAGVLEAL